MKNLKVAVFTLFMLSYVSVPLNAESCSGRNAKFSKLCDCAGNTVTTYICKCTARWTFKLSELQIYESKGVKNVTIEGCGEVYVDASSFQNMELDTIIFKDSPLRFSPLFAFNIKKIKALEIRDSDEIVVEKNALLGLRSVQRVTFSNVEAGSRGPSFELQLNGTHTLTLDRCHVGNLSKNSFIAGNIKNIIISNSVFRDMANESIFMHNVENLIVDKTTFNLIPSNSLTVVATNHVTFTKCNFMNLQSNSMHVDETNNFLFDSNSVYNAETDAFSSVNVRAITFYNNSFFKTQALFLGASLQINNFVASGNSIVCSRRNPWLWEFEQMYQPFLKNAKCLKDGTPVKEFLSPNCAS